MIVEMKPTRHRLIDELFAMGDAIRADTGVARPVQRVFFFAVKEDRYNDPIPLQKEAQFIADYLTDLQYALTESIKLGFEKAKTFRSVFDEHGQITREVYGERGVDPARRLQHIDRKKTETITHIFDTNSGIRQSLTDVNDQATTLDSLLAALNIRVLKHGLGDDALTAATTKLGKIIKSAANPA